MLQKVLISFLGTSLPKDREYKNATYKFTDNQESYEYSFIAQAIKKRYDIDKLILIGTPHSMWENVYSQFAGSSKNETVEEEIFDYCINANHNTVETEIPHQREIEKALGGDSKVIIIRYGMDDDEITANMQAILRTKEYLGHGDELYVDITHSFRSLPLYLMNVLIYLQEVAGNGINIKKVLYGMLDVTTEFGYTPVVELNQLLNMNKWISAANMFKETGDTKDIIALIEKDYPNLVEPLTAFTSLLCMNQLDALQRRITQLRGLFPKPQVPEYTPKAMIVDPIIRDFCKQYGGLDEKPEKFQYLIAKWHFDHRRYGLSYLALCEAIVTLVCIKNSGNKITVQQNNMDVEFVLRTADWQYQEVRDAIKRKFRTYAELEIAEIYYKLTPVRNSVAHMVEIDTSHKEMVRTLSDSIKKLQMWL